VRRGCQPNSFTDPEDNQVTAEQFGEGVDRMRAELTGLGLPEPEYEAVSFMLRCTVRAAEVREQGADANDRQRETPASRSKATQKTGEKTSEKILNLLRVSPSLSTAELAVTIGITDKGVAWQLNRLCRDGLLRRVGPAKGGHWAVADAKE